MKIYHPFFSFITFALILTSCIESTDKAIQAQNKNTGIDLNVDHSKEINFDFSTIDQRINTAQDLSFEDTDGILFGDLSFSKMDMNENRSDLQIESIVDMQLMVDMQRMVDMQLMVDICGDGIRTGVEACDEASDRCVDCQIPCQYAGGRACGGNTIPGDSHFLYECDGQHFVVIEDCGQLCERLPQGIPDRCPPENQANQANQAVVQIPQALLDTLSPVPYVEGNCTPIQVNNWPYEAKNCRYRAGGISTSVITATPSPDQVARWIIDAVTLIPSVQNLKQSNEAQYINALIAIAQAVLNQSSRIFPLDGGIIENMGNGYENYIFDRGVTSGCSTGCYCRINSLHRNQWCTYEADILGGNREACLDRMGRRGLTEAWGNQCLQNHIDAWHSDQNQHFRAKAYMYQLSIINQCPNLNACTPNQVLRALNTAISEN